MHLANRALNEWLLEASSLQLFALLGAVGFLVRYLQKNADSLSERRFVGVSIVLGLAASFAIGATFRTPIVAWILGLPLGVMPERTLNWIKAGLAFLAVYVMVREARAKLQKTRIRPCWPRGALLGLAVMSLSAYFSFGDIGYLDFYHRHEFFHYYLGAKYSRELGYDRIYPCTAVAQSELGQENEVRARKMMNLVTDVVVPAKTALEHPEDCKERFSPDDWVSFKDDVRFFRNSSNLAYWNHMQTDHGYNPPPVWTMMGRIFATRVSPSVVHFQWLAGIDLALWVGIFGAIGWAFAARVFAVSAIFFGCQLPAEALWTAGAFMRQDWLFWLVLSACLARKRYFFLSGAAVAFSTLLRIFPGLLLAGVAIVIVRHLWRYRRFDPTHLRFACGGVLATAILVSVSVGVTGANAYPAFYDHIQVHNHTPLTNNMGLPMVLGQSYAGRMKFVEDPKRDDPCEVWENLHRARLAVFRPFELVLWIAAGLALVRVLWRVKSIWIAMALSLVVVVSVLELTCYYYSMFLLATLLSRHRPGVAQWVLVVAGASQLLAVNRFLATYYDDRYTAESVLFCFFAASLIAAYWPTSKKLRRSAALVPS